MVNPLALSVATQADITKYARGALVKADALNVTPTPLAAVEAAIGLHPSTDLFAAGEELPSKFKSAAALLRRKVIGALDYREKVVYLDQDLSNERQRFTHGHELGHAALPWQRPVYHADDDNTISPDTREQLEIEANAFSADLLFGVDRFTAMADDFKSGLGAPLALNGQFQTSAHAAIRRYAETTRHPIALITLGRFPNWTGGRLSMKVMQAMQSASFEERYGSVAAMVRNTIAVDSQRAVKLAYDTEGPGIRDAVNMVLETRRGMTTFVAESFNNGHFTFLVLSRRQRFAGRPVTIMQPSARVPT